MQKMLNWLLRKNTSLIPEQTNNYSQNGRHPSIAHAVNKVCY